MLISILICTRNRLEKLRRTLEAIAGLEVPPGVDYEVLVLENGPSSAGAADVCNDLTSSFHGRLRSFHLAVSGKSCAANAGFAMSRGEITAFLDDDILPRKDWLSVIFQEFASDPELGGISGAVELLNKRDLPVAIRRHKERTSFSCATDAYNLFIGCNFAVRRTLVERVGLFDPNFGPGRRVESNEDVDFFYRLWKAGEKLVYVPSLFVYHGHGRQSPQEEINIMRSYIVGRGAFFAKHMMQGDALLARVMFWEVWSGLQDSFRRGGGANLRHLIWLISGFFHCGLIRALQSVRASKKPELSSLPR